jgi:hypothetical protein
MSVFYGTSVAGRGAKGGLRGFDWTVSNRDDYVAGSLGQATKREVQAGVLRNPKLAPPQRMFGKWCCVESAGKDRDTERIRKGIRKKLAVMGPVCGSKALTPCFSLSSLLERSSWKSARGYAHTKDNRDWLRRMDFGASPIVHSPKRAELFGQALNSPRLCQNDCGDLARHRARRLLDRRRCTRRWTSASL